MEEFRIIVRYKTIVRYKDAEKSEILRLPTLKVFKSWNREQAIARTRHLKSILEANNYRILDIELLKVESISF